MSEETEGEIVEISDALEEFESKNSLEYDFAGIRKLISNENMVKRNILSKLDNKENFYGRLKTFRDNQIEAGKTNFIVEDINEFVELRFTKILNMAFKYYDNDSVLDDEKTKMTVEEEVLVGKLVHAIRDFKTSIYKKSDKS